MLFQGHRAATEQRIFQQVRQSDFLSGDLVVVIG